MAIFKIKSFGFLDSLFRKKDIPSRKGKVSSDFEFKTEDIWTVSGVGIVATGKILSGTIELWGEVLCRDTDQIYTISRITQSGKEVKNAREGDLVGLALKEADRGDVKKGMTLVKPENNGKLSGNRK